MKKSIIIILFLSLGSNAQTVKLNKGAQQYKDLAYVDAIKTYEKIAEKGYKSVDLFEKLGDSYYFNAKLKEANKWYAELFALNQPVEPEYYYRYAQTLKATENYSKADQYLELFHQKAGNDIRGNLYASQKDYKEVIAKNSGRYEIKTTSVNSHLSDFGSAVYNNNLVFSTSRDTTGIIKVKTKWNNRPLTNLYSAKINEDGSLGKPEKFSKNINSKFHESTPIFTKDLKTVYFTRNNYNEGKTGKDTDRKIGLKLYKATLIEGKWENIVELPFNSDNYNVAHPALSPDEKFLYFASNMPGTKGASDIFKVEITGENTYGTPVNLTGDINTEGRETFPYITKNNELYFASDGHQGLGGLDVFVAKLDAQGNPETIVNVGAPINGSMDDFAFMIDSDSQKGYFSSNRTGGAGDDDIYSFTEKKALDLDIKQALEGVVTNLETGEILDNAKVTLYDENFNPIQETTSDAKGNYALPVEPGKKYYVRAEKDEYETKELPVLIPKTSGKTDLPIATSKKVKEVKAGTDLAKIFDIKVIYFDLDKSDIRKDAAIDLEKILYVMQQNPTIKVDVRSHTDSRQTASYNIKLSDRRAKSTIAWLVQNGINANRLTGKGYGESQLINKCADGVPCSEEEHQANRRSEFIVISM